MIIEGACTNKFHVFICPLCNSFNFSILLQWHCFCQSYAFITNKSNHSFPKAAQIVFWKGYQLQKNSLAHVFFFHRNQFKLFPLIEHVITANEADSFNTHYIKKIRVFPFLLKYLSIFYFLHCGIGHCEINCATHKGTTGFTDFKIKCAIKREINRTYTFSYLFSEIERHGIVVITITSRFSVAQYQQWGSSLIPAAGVSSGYV
jgi:hypothetical protein